MCCYSDYINNLNQSLEKMVVTNEQNQELSCEEGILSWCSLTQDLRNKSSTMFFVGNGASAMMASHMAADASKNGGIRALAFNDPALLTAVSNDISYEQSFVIPLKRFATQGDVLVTISSSGNSPNIIAAITAMRELNLHVVTLSGMQSDNKSRRLGFINFYVPAKTYGLVEAAHQAVLHCWLDSYMDLNGEIFDV